MRTYGDEDAEDDEDAEHGHGARRERRHDLAERVELACAEKQYPAPGPGQALGITSHMVFYGWSRVTSFWQQP